MASSINASTSGAGGVITTADNSGILNLQSNGTTVATVSSSGFSTPANQTINTANTFGFKNRIINGGMTIDQRNAGASTSVTNATDFFLVDRFKAYRTTGGTLTTQQSTTVPTGFSKSLQLTATTGASAGASDVNFFQQCIEGLNVADLGWGTADAKTITVSFWLRTSVTGTYGISISNSGLTRTYVSTVTVSAANTFAQYSITIPGDTSGTWLTDNGIGLRLYVDLGSGSNYNLTANTWGSTWGTRTSGCVSWYATTGATFYITGVQLEVGSQATSFDFRSIGQETFLCQRYFYKPSDLSGGNPLYGSVYGASGGLVSVPLVTMRTTPSGTATANALVYAVYAITGVAVVSIASTTPNITAFTASAEL